MGMSGEGFATCGVCQTQYRKFTTVTKMGRNWDLERVSAPCTHGHAPCVHCARFWTNTRANGLPLEAIKMVPFGGLWGMPQLPTAILSECRGSRGLRFIPGVLEAYW